MIEQIKPCPFCGRPPDSPFDLDLHVYEFAAAIKARWQADIITELQNHMMNNGYSDEAAGVCAWFEERQRAQEAGDA